MATFFEQTVTIGGVVFYPIESVPVESARDVRSYDADVTAALADGTPVILRDAANPGNPIIPQPLKSSPQNGFVPALLASQPMFYYNTAVGTVFVVSPAYRNLQLDFDGVIGSVAGLQASAASSAAAASSASSAASTASAQAASAQAAALTAQQQAEAAAEAAANASGTIVREATTEAEANSFPNGTLVLLVIT